MVSDTRLGMGHCTPIPFIDLWYPGRASEEIVPGQDVPMTLIGVIKEGEEALLIASDNLERSTGGFSVTPRSKLHRLEDKAFAWACTGNATLSEWLSQELANNNPQSWDDITGHNGFRDSVATLNGNEKAGLTLARSNPGPDHLVTSVMAGWLNSEPGMWDLDENGQPTPHLDRDVLFEGGPVRALLAYSIWDALNDSPKSIVDRLQAVYRIIGARERSIDEVPDIWRITPDGITIVQGRDGLI